MYKGYEELNALPAEAFLHPENFDTQFDAFGGEDGAILQYETGLRYANEYEEVGISANGTWYAEQKIIGKYKGGLMTSYEGIGYHANTAALLRGLLAGKARFVVRRYDADPVTIKESTHGH